MRVTEGLHNHEAIKQAAGGFRPVASVKNNVAIDPDHFAAVVGQRPHRQIQQSLVLPHHVMAAYLYENLRVVIIQFEVQPISQFDGDEWNLQALTK